MEMPWLQFGCRSAAAAKGVRLKRGPSATGKLAERGAEYN
jgi:hypothetical protein